VESKFKDAEEFKLCLRQFSINTTSIVFSKRMMSRLSQQNTQMRYASSVGGHSRLPNKVTYEVRVFQEKDICTWVNKSENDVISYKWIVRHILQDIRDMTLAK